MKRTAFSRWMGACLLALSLVAAPTVLPAAAQDNPASGNNSAQDFKSNNAPNLDTTPLQETKGKTDNYGWLGLIGLLGLLNLLRKPKTTVTYREPDVTTRAGDRY